MKEQAQFNDWKVDQYLKGKQEHEQVRSQNELAAINANMNAMNLSNSRRRNSRAQIIDDDL